MFLLWDEDLSTGINEMDAQHKRLVEAVSRIMDYLWEGNGKKGVCSELNFLKEYTIFHFNDEELLMFKHEYPKLEQHKGEHKKFVNNILILEEKCKKKEVMSDTAIETFDMIWDWLKHHIKVVDKDYGAFISGKRTGLK